MKHILAALFFVCATAHAGTTEWWLDNDPTKVYSTQTACDTAADKVPGVHSCPRMRRVPCPAQPATQTRTTMCPGSTVTFTQTSTYTSAPAPACWQAGPWLPTTSPSCPVAASTWTRIASENQLFTVGLNQTVRFGRDPAYVQKVMSGAGQCTNDFFGSDPAPGQGKFCDVLDGATPPPPVTGSASLTWAAPTTNADGTPLTDLASYRVDYGPASGLYTASLATAAPSATVPNLSSGPWFFVVRALDTAGNVSAPSAEVSKVIP